MMQLVQLENNQVIRRISLEKESYSIGRSQESDIVLDHPKVSRLHARIFFKEGQYFIEDLDSTNYVFINGVRIKQKQLAVNDKIQVSSDVLLIFSEPEKQRNIGSQTMADMQKHFIHKDDLERLTLVSSSILSLQKLDNILLKILKEGLQLIDAERGFIVLTDPKGNILWRYATSYHIDKELAAKGQADISHSILKEAIDTQDTVVRLSDQALTTDSMAGLKIYSAMCTPLIVGERLIGLFYADAKQFMNNFTEVDQYLFKFLASQASIAIVNAKRYNDLLGKYEAQKSEYEALLAQTGSTPPPTQEPPLEPHIEGVKNVHTYSAGGVVINPSGQVLIVNQKGSSWSLPKGHIEVGEEPAITAQREILEESGIQYLHMLCSLGSYQRSALNAEGTADHSIQKTIYMYLFRTDETELSPQDPDTPEARWVEIDQVNTFLTHPQDQTFFRQVMTRLPEHLPNS